MKTQPENTEKQSTASSKKEYKSPELRKIGNFSELTLGPTGSVADGNSGMNRS